MEEFFVNAGETDELEGNTFAVYVKLPQELLETLTNGGASNISIALDKTHNQATLIVDGKPHSFSYEDEGQTIHEFYIEEGNQWTKGGVIRNKLLTTQELSTSVQARVKEKAMQADQQKKAHK